MHIHVKQRHLARKITLLYDVYIILKTHKNIYRYTVSYSKIIFFYIFVTFCNPFSMIKKIVMIWYIFLILQNIWRPPSLSELTVLSIIGLTHLCSEAFVKN